MVTRLIRAGVAGVLWVAAAQAQTAEELVRSGVEAYERLQYATAATALRQAVAAGGPDALTRTRRHEALAYLAAARLLSGERTAAAAVVAELLAEDPQYRVDELIFPPQVSGLFTQVASRLGAIEASVSPDTAIRPASDRWIIRLAVSAPQDLQVIIEDDAGDTVGMLHRGAVNDTLTLGWDGLDRHNAVVTTGRYWLRVTGARELRRPLELRLDAVNPLPLPGLPDSLLLPEREGWGPALQALAGGLGAGALIALAPGLLAPSQAHDGVRFAVIGAVGIATVAGLLVHRPGRRLPDHARANRLTADRWRAAVDSVQAENQRRRGATRLFIRAGPTETRGGGRP